MNEEAIGLGLFSLRLYRQQHSSLAVAAEIDSARSIQTGVS